MNNRGTFFFESFEKWADKDFENPTLHFFNFCNSKFEFLTVYSNLTKITPDVGRNHRSNNLNFSKQSIDNEDIQQPCRWSTEQDTIYTRKLNRFLRDFIPV